MKLQVWAMAGAALLWSCAQVSSPTGGAEDTAPPQVVDGMPAYGATGVRPEALVLTFDEYVVARNTAAQLLVSPPLEHIGRPVVRGKTLTLPLPSAALSPGTTYVFAFGDGIVDLHEGLPASGLQWAFSTGERLDTLAIAGTVVERTTGAGAAGVRVWAYPADLPLDSLLAGSPPQRVAVTEAGGAFTLRHLAPGKYRVWAVLDADRNYKWAENEATALLELPALAGDSTVHRLVLDAPLPAPALQSAVGDTTGFVRIALTGGQDVQLQSVPAVEGVEVHVWGTDSAWAWTRAAVPMPGRWAMPGVDTVEVRPPRRTAAPALDVVGVRWDSLPGHRVLQGALPGAGRREVQWNRPLERIDPAKWELTRDSALVDCTVALGQFPGTVAWTVKEELPGAYCLRILPGAAVACGGVVREDTVAMRWEVRGPESWAELVVVPEREFAAGWLEVRNAAGQVVAAQRVDFTVREVRFSGLAPGKVALAMRMDLNGNGRWDGIDVPQWRAPEPMVHGAVAMEVRANWVLEVVWPAENGSIVP